MTDRAKDDIQTGNEEAQLSNQTENHQIGDLETKTEKIATDYSNLEKEETNQTDAEGAGKKVAEETMDSSETINDSATQPGTLENEKITTEIPRSTEAELYSQNKQADHAEIQRLIGSAEQELADLKLRKSLMEADFSQLLEEYRRLILPQVEISVIAKKTLLEYFSYELLKPLHSIDLRQGDSYGYWETKHFSIRYGLDENENLALSFKMKPIDSRFLTDYMNFMTVQPEAMAITVEDEQVLELIRLWHVERVFSLNQLSLINYDLNQLLAHFRTLGFNVEPSLLDNARPLQVHLESEFPLKQTVLDDIFITAMENPMYDFDKQTEQRYRILLDQEQSLTIGVGEADHTSLFIDSNNRRRSLLDFFTSYSFLVPLMVRQG